MSHFFMCSCDEHAKLHLSTKFGEDCFKNTKLGQYLSHEKKIFECFDLKSLSKSIFSLSCFKI